MPLYARPYHEQRLSESLRDTLTVGQAFDLKLENDESFLAFYSEAPTTKAVGAVVLLHDLDGHLDWPDIIGPLRTELVKYGWNTLSLQLASQGSFNRAKDYQGLYRDASKRLAAAIAFLQQRSVDKIILIGHGLGGSMGLYYLASFKDAPNKTIIAFIGIAMHDPDAMAVEYTTSNAVANLKLPILDIYGTQDSVDVLNAVTQRKTAANKTGSQFLEQLPFKGGDHFLTGLQKSLLIRIRGWADKRASSIDNDKPPAKEASP